MEANRAAIVALGLLLALVTTGHAQDDTDLAPPWELSSVEDGEPSWAPLFRLREAESAYRSSDAWRGAYFQMRSQLEAAAGNHAAALAFWDAATGPRDTTTELPAGVHAVDALAYLSALADTAQVLMINERHHAASDRLLTLHLLAPLYAKGYRYFAAETLSHGDTTLAERGYPTTATGHYTNEPVFAAVVREALRLGYTIVPYEQMPEQKGDEELTPQQARDHAQAENLVAKIFSADPQAKVLVHAGYSHILEEATERWHPMAAYLREMTGIDPVTVDQTRLSERSEPAYEHPAYRAAIEAGLLEDTPVILLNASDAPYRPAEFAVDVQVLTPRTTTTEGRPGWMALDDRRPTRIAIPEARDQWCMVQARVAGEPPEASVLDRVEAQGVDEVLLFLPSGQDVDLRIWSQDGTLLRESRHATAP